MSNLTLYRRWRPKTFDEVKGREDIVTILKNQIKNDRVAHAYLFCGTRGTGKTSIAKIFAKAVNCEAPVDGSPCYKCKTCVALNENNLDIIEIDAASNNGVDNIRDIRSEAEYLPNVGKYKVYIIDEVHMLSTGAFNALLKILEEPPEYVIFILATTEINKIPVTILSRCQRFDFLPVNINTIYEHLKNVAEKESIRISDDAIKYLSEIADGGFRDGLSLLDQVSTYAGNDELNLSTIMKILGRDSYKNYHELLIDIKNKNMIGINSTIDRISSEGKTHTNFVSEFANYVKNLAMVKISGEVFDNLTQEEFNCIVEDCDLFTVEYLTFMLDNMVRLNEQLKFIENKRMFIDLTFIRIVMPQDSKDMESIIARIENIENKFENFQSVSVQSIISKDFEDNDRDDFIHKNDVEKINLLSSDIKDILTKWRSINWDKDEAAGKIKQYINKAAVAVKDDKLHILAKEEIVYKQLHNKHELIHKVIKEQTGFDAEIVVLKEKFEKGIDLRDLIKFEIEKE